MQNFAKPFVIGIVLLLLAGCATVKDVQRAADLIRSDNELTRLLVEVRPGDQAGAAIYLGGLAAHARGEAETLKGDRSRIPDAIAYYRIAATAYWRSGSKEVVNELFEVTNAGTKLCADLGNNAPDRDCLFLQLVIPFAGIEAVEKDSGLSGLLDRVNFSDGSATPDEIGAMKSIDRSLTQVKPLVQKVLALSQDNRFLSHPGMREYYCTNAKKAFDYYDGKVGVFGTKVEEFSREFPGGNLGVSKEEAAGLKLGKGVPGFCNK